MEIRVICYAGFRGEETPRRLILGTRSIEVVAVQDRWLAPDHRYFKLTGDDGNRYIIRHDPQQDSWQLTCYKNGLKSDPKVIVDCGRNPSDCKH